jgi:hypothetical protein
LKIIQKTLLCSVGHEPHSNLYWIVGKGYGNNLCNLDFAIPHLVAEELNTTPDELHEATSRKLLKIEIAIVIGKCELIDETQK